ncbi:hypothetical protein GWI33_010676 [Rhynchophorus ferrugineus]|uniref:Uncharacterized protein n=1 Tax=Rhynchophorus ferrugineus TaxID=354439 RepID=A0A834IUQ2_RHYFE|nr:hypothetical protein GWI33_010676 [Rhynchophorus ferrugineus]
MATEIEMESNRSTGNVNKQLLENQSFLYNENQRLQENVRRLSKHLDELKKNSVDPKVLEHLMSEKGNLIALNDTLKKKIKELKSLPASITKEDLEKHQTEKQELLQSIDELDIVLSRINNRSEAFEFTLPKESTVQKLCDTLTKRLEEEQQRSDEALETIRRLRDDDEKMMLKDKISDLKQLITDLEVENTKMKFETEQLADEIQRQKINVEDAAKDIRELKKEKYRLEDEVDKLKQNISDLENDKLNLKKDMIEELTEANRAKRVSADTEIALQHISEAYENKRKEVAKYQKQLDEANTIIKAFREQFDKSDTLKSWNQ